MYCLLVQTLFFILLLSLTFFFNLVFYSLFCVCISVHTLLDFPLGVLNCLHRFHIEQMPLLLSTAQVTHLPHVRHTVVTMTTESVTLP